MTGMSNEIRNRLEQYIHQEHTLHSQLCQLKVQQANVSAEATKTLTSLGAGAILAS